MSETELQSSGQYESKAESDKSRQDLVARWMAEIDLASTAEKGWREEADKARQIYRAEKEGESKRFNILFTNVQTEVPSLYNSTPTPDVRTRYSDEDNVSRLAGQAIERVLSYSVDQYNFDGTIKAAVQDRQLAGRGQGRVRYVPYEYQGRIYQEVSCELVAWKHYRVGPATRWDDRPWEAFEHFLTRDQLVKLSPQIGGGIALDFAITSETDRSKADAAPNVFKRARVWEIWDKQTRKVIWIAPAYKDGPIRTDDDPYGLTGFFATPEAMYAIKTSDSLVPVCPYRIIAPLAEELEEVTRRIQALVKVCRWRGYRNPALPGWEALSEADDGELIAPADGAEIMALIQSGGLDKHIWLMPIDQVVKVLQQLYVQREQIKQTIFEVSGLSDILRGQSDPDETLGAQEIKANFGSMRLQDSQRDVQRFCRDLFRLKAEIACNMFQSDNLKMMTGLQQPSRKDVMAAQAQLKQIEMQAQQQASAMAPGMGHNGGPPMGAQPQPDPKLVAMANEVAWEDILEILKSGISRAYRVDIETDSTIRGEIRQQQQSAATFLQGTAQFITAIGPAVQSGMMTAEVAVDLFSGFARMFRLGKQAEDALQRLSQQAQEAAKNPAPPQPSPEEIKMKMEAEKTKMQMGMAREKHQLDMAKTKMGIEAQKESAQVDLQAKQQAAEMDFAIEQQKAQMDFANQQQQSDMDAAMQSRQMQMDAQAQERKARAEERSGALKEKIDMRKAALAEALARMKADREPRKYDA